MILESFAAGRWERPDGESRPVYDAVTGEVVAEVARGGLNYTGMMRFAREEGGRNLRAMTFHERGRMLKGLAGALGKAKDELYALSHRTGATKEDAWVDVDGGIGTLFVYSSKGRRELPDDHAMLDGAMERTSRNGTFVGHHIKVPRRGVALHINAYNFPVWGMLEKLAPTWLAGMPAIVKPASATSYVTAAAVRIMLESGLLPDGALQLIVGGVGDSFEHLTSQDVVTFTGSAQTGRMLKSHPKIVEESVRFNMEADSLNFAMLGPDAAADSPEFDLFVKEVANEMRIKTGQRCTAIRRALIPKERMDDVVQALRASFDATPVGNPVDASVKMGPLVSQEQRREVRKAVETLKADGARVLYGDDTLSLVDADVDKGAFHPFTLLCCDASMDAKAAHEIEAFGPVSTLMPYGDVDQACELIRRGGGSLVGTVVTGDDSVARTVVLETASHHGRIHILNAECAEESTGHGSPLPHLVHGGPGRAGGGEELGGIRGMDLYMQRTAIQGSPTTLSAVGGTYLPGAKRTPLPVHPFRKHFDEIQVGDSLTTHRRTVTEADIVNFAGITGDFFYAHVDEAAAQANPLFKGRVAHGYFVLSAAAGLFVDPGVGPVLANYGLNELRFIEPVRAGDTIQAALTCKRKIPKDKKPDEQLQGVVEWDVEVTNQHSEIVASYSILTMVAVSEN